MSDDVERMLVLTYIVIFEKAMGDMVKDTRRRLFYVVRGIEEELRMTCR